MFVEYHRIIKLDMKITSFLDVEDEENADIFYVGFLDLLFEAVFSLP